MPSAIPFQKGLIGLYNNAHSPGVYVSWDPNTSFNSTFSVIFKGDEQSNYRFPLIVSNYTIGGVSTVLGTPLALGAGSTYIYCLTADKIIAYQKTGDTFTTRGTISCSGINTSYNPNTLKVGTIGTSEVILLGYNAGFCGILTFSGSTFIPTSGITYTSISGISTSSYNGYDITLSKSSLFFSYQGNVYGGPVSLSNTNNLSLGAGATGVIINSANGIQSGATISKIDAYCGKKIAVSDSENTIYEFLYDGNIGAGYTSTVWTLSFSLLPDSNQVWSSLIYNHFGIIVASDSYNNTVNVIASANATITDNYGTMDGFSYQIESVSTSTETQGRITNSVGGPGVNYLQFDTPLCLTEDSEFNIIIGDLNNRLTYLPTNLNYISNVQAPLNEFIDSTGNPSETYFIKQATCDYSNIMSLPPVTADELLIKSSVLYELNSLLRVAVYDEELIWDYNRQSGTLAYGDIVTDPAPQLRITVSSNQGQRSPMYVLNPYTGITNTLDQSLSDSFDAPEVTSNYANGLYYRFNNEGKVFFFDVNGVAVSVQEYDNILVTYYVKLFTNTQINNALYLALQSINAMPGLNKIYSVSACPFYYDSTLVTGACYYLIRQLLVGLNQRERRLLVQDPESGSFDAVANLKDLAKMYKEDFDELLKKLSIAKRPIMGTITVPEYAMPGGRSRLFRALWKGGAS